MMDGIGDADGGQEKDEVRRRVDVRNEGKQSERRMTGRIDYPEPFFALRDIATHGGVGGKELTIIHSGE